MRLFPDDDISKITIVECEVTKEFQSELLKYSISGYAIRIILSLIIPVLGPFYLLFKALENFSCTHTRCYRIIEKPFWIYSRKYPKKQKVSYYYKIKEYNRKRVRLRTIEKSFFIIKGIIALVLAIIISAAQVHILLYL